MVDPGVILKRAEQIEKHLDRIRPFTSLSYDAFLKDSIIQDVVEYNLFQVVNHLIDIFQHIVVDEEYGFPETAYEAFLKDSIIQDVVEYNLFQVVNHLIDIFQHVVVDEQYGFPETAYEAAQILLTKGILREAEAEKFKQMVGFRNVVGHDYISINKEAVYQILTHGEKDIRALLTRIVSRFL